MRQAVKGRISARKLTILLLLAAKDAKGIDRAPIIGTTRMQKLAFLAMQSCKDFLRGDDVFRFDFVFAPDRFGPADLELYQDLELLKATGWIEVDGKTRMAIEEPATVLDEEAGKGLPVLPEEQDEEEISFDYLMGEHSEEIDLAEAERRYERQYRITDEGMGRLEVIRVESRREETFNRLAKVCAAVKLEYGNWPLNLLLRHVYSEYPEMTTKSEIRDRVC